MGFDFSPRIDTNFDENYLKLVSIRITCAAQQVQAFVANFWFDISVPTVRTQCQRVEKESLRGSGSEGDMNV